MTAIPLIRDMPGLTVYAVMHHHTPSSLSSPCIILHHAMFAPLGANIVVVPAGTGLDQRSPCA